MESSDNRKPPPPEAAPSGKRNGSSTEQEASISRASTEPMSNTTAPSPQDAALAEAEAVLEALGGNDNVLQSFNLLGVIANPTGLPLTQSSFHGRYSAAGNSSASGGLHLSQAHVASSEETTSATDYFTDTYLSIESTLTHVTEQMDAFSHVMDDWSKHLLDEDDAVADETAVPESQLTELPAELTNLDLNPLRQYLEQSGDLAQSLRRRQLEARPCAAAISDTEEPTVPTSLSASTASHEPLQRLSSLSTDAIPSIFFDADFDLTDPVTFSKLLLDNENDEQAVAETTASSATDKAKKSATAKDENRDSVVRQSVPEWFPLPPQETCGGYLDKVELALLQQVRNKSGAFFEESLRFAQLQEWIQSLWVSVSQLQETCRILQRDLVEPQETVPRANAQRAELLQLVSVLDQANDLVQCKSSVGGLLSAQEDLSAVEQIQYGRMLLSGRHRRQSTDSTTSTGPSPVKLGRLQSLKGVAEQLNQYEQLVVTNLREELVELFLEWNNSTSPSALYSTALHHTPTGAGAQAAASPQVQQRVREIYGALETCQGGLAATRQAYNTRLQDVIRMTVRTTVGEFAADDSAGSAAQSVSVGVTGMSLERFLDCLDMLFEQLLALLTSAAGVDEFCIKEGFNFQDAKDDDDVLLIRQAASTDSKDAKTKAGAKSESSPMAAVLAASGELCSKSISELLRLRKDAHSLVTLEEMKRIWDACYGFTNQVESLSGHKAIALRSTLLAQAKGFVERKHESNMSALVAALDSERWTQCEVSVERQNALTRLCTGRAVSATSKRISESETTPVQVEKQPEAEVEGTRYKTVWSCLLLIEMVINDIATAAHFQSLASNLVNKVSELLRLFNSRTTQLVLGAGAIHSAARLKSINAKHLSLVTQCLGMVISILPHVRAALMAQMPPKQHNLLSSIDQIKKDYAEHNEKVLNKFVTIIGGIVEHGLAPKIAGTNFDARAKMPPAADGSVACCIFLDGVSTNTRKMHQVLSSLLPPDHLQDVFSRIFAFVDNKVPTLLIAATQPTQPSPKKVANSPGTRASPKAVPPTFTFPKTEDGKRRLLLEVGTMTSNLNSLDGVKPWDFTAVEVLERRLEYKLEPATTSPVSDSNGQAPTPTNDGETSDAGTDVTTETSVTTNPDESSPSKDTPQKQEDVDAEPNGDSITEDEPTTAQQGGPSEEASAAPVSAEPSLATVSNAPSEAAPASVAATESESDESAKPNETAAVDDAAAASGDAEGAPKEEPNNQYPSEVTAL